MNINQIFNTMIEKLRDLRRSKDLKLRLKFNQAMVEGIIKGLDEGKKNER